MMRLLIILLCAVSAFAAEPPVIPDQLKAAFFKAQVQFLQAGDKEQAAQREVLAKQDALAKSVDDLSKFCGKGYEVKWDDKQEPACVATIPVVNKPAEVKKP